MFPFEHYDHTREEVYHMHLLGYAIRFLTSRLQERKSHLSKNYLFGGADKKPSLNGHTIEFYNRRVKKLEPHTNK